MRRIQAFLKDAEAVQLKTNLASHFMSKMWDLAYDVEDIIDKYFPKLIPSKSPWRHMIIACGFAKEVEGIKNRAKDITKAIQGFKIDDNNFGEVVTWDPRPPNFAHCNDPNVVGLDKQIEDLVQRVRGEELHCVVSIIAWIVVSQHPNGKELLRDIAGQVGLPKNEMKNNVKANLYAFLCTRRYVIMIDDIWDIKAWNPLKPGLPTDSEKAEGFIRGSDVRQVEVVGDEYLNHFIARNLIQVGRMSFKGRVKSVRIHDILHDLSIKEAKEINFLNIPTDAMNCIVVLKVRRVAMRGISTDHNLSFNP
ncbi:hypothetical protein Vadar_023033 [Vaccinium darrowii]|uniref:Uncharacterized protein n=1 Tax=Vaccinium darrowii TaxID=229202 RepID=A0ACB7X2Z2_9ERIC|nr:hypothetical protein Vadar_023033 [Vaccinium darrowii]